MKTLTFLLLALLSTNLLAETMPLVSLEKELGGRLDGSAWISSELQNKVHVLFYVDPDEKDLNEPLSERLKAENFDRANYQSVAVINMAATWLPNFALEGSLKSKQEKYPDTIYVKDFEKVLVKKWELKDDSNNVLLFDKKGSVLYKIMGAATNEQIEEFIGLIKKNL